MPKLSRTNYLLADKFAPGSFDRAKARERGRRKPYECALLECAKNDESVGSYGRKPYECALLECVKKYGITERKRQIMAGMNPTQIFQLMGAWQKFTANHPKFPKFLNAVAAEGVKEDTIIEVNITTPEGKTYCSNLKITQSDMELFEQIKQMS